MDISQKDERKPVRLLTLVGSPARCRHGRFIASPPVRYVAPRVSRCVFARRSFRPTRKSRSCMTS